MNALHNLLSKLPLGQKWKTATGLIVAALAALASNLGWIEPDMRDSLLTLGLGLSGLGVLHRDATKT